MTRFTVGVTSLVEHNLAAIRAMVVLNRLPGVRNVEVVRIEGDEADLSFETRSESAPINLETQLEAFGLRWRFTRRS